VDDALLVRGPDVDVGQRVKKALAVPGHGVTGRAGLVEGVLEGIQVLLDEAVAEGAQAPAQAAQGVVDRPLVAHQHVPPHVEGRRRNARHVAEPAPGELQGEIAVRVVFGGGHEVDKGHGQELRHVAGGGDEAVVAGGIQHERPAASGFNQLNNGGQRSVQGRLVASLRKTEAVDCVLEEQRVGVINAAVLGAGHRVASQECDVVGEHVLGLLEHGCFHRGHVGHEAPVRKCVGNGVEQPDCRGEGRGEDDEVGLRHGGYGIGRFLVDGPAVLGLFQNLRPVVSDDRDLGLTLGPGEPEGAADETRSDNGKTFDHARGRKWRKRRDIPVGSSDRTQSGKRMHAGAATDVRRGERA
jgi:hypothetical protein